VEGERKIDAYGGRMRRPGERRSTRRCAWRWKEPPLLSGYTLSDSSRWRESSTANGAPTPGPGRSRTTRGEQIWGTVGVNDNNHEASWEALLRGRRRIRSFCSEEEKKHAAPAVS